MYGYINGDALILFTALLIAFIGSVRLGRDNVDMSNNNFSWSTFWIITGAVCIMLMSFINIINMYNAMIVLGR